ncbi:MFS transporter [Nocardioides sp. GY 10127]|uniref:MFS transporter n=1 Tax=Nocardioides sp. GY 10127 TaxID=2569762 RepID=UPI0010A94495|nr:MFS transporter [Nocardioides sp. GY 10127]TIC80170.1 MFS transporter [Nocardioides sp. GY 10127]
MSVLSAADVEVGPADGDPRHRPGSAGYRRLNVAMFFAGLAAFGLMYGTQPLLPQLTSTFGVDATRAALTVSVTTGALALCTAPAAALAERAGRVRVIRVALVVAALASLACVVAPTFEVLVIARLVLGAALGGVLGTAMGHVGTEVHPAGLGASMGLYVAGNTIGGVSGRVLTSIAADLAGWRGGLLTLTVFCVVAMVLFWALLPQPVLFTDASRGAAGAGRDKVLALVVLVVVPFALMGGFVAVYNYLTYRLTSAPFDLTPALAGLAFLAYLAGTVTSATAGRLADRVGRLPVLLAGTAVMLVGLAITLSGSLALVILGLVVFTAGFFAAHATASGWAPQLLPSAPGRASASYVMTYYAGSSIFGAALGFAWHGGGWPGVATAVACLTVVGALAATTAWALSRERG